MKKLATLTFCLFVLFTKAQEPTQWRGNGSTGIYPAEKLMAQWPAAGPDIIWSVGDLGEGFSSPVFANGKIYITGMVGGQGVLFVIDKNGTPAKKYEYGKEWDTSYPGTRSTVTVAGSLAYLYSGHGKLACFDLDSEKMKWTVDLIADLSGTNITWGVTESVVVDGDRVYCSPGGKTNNVVALDRFSGKTIWACAGLGEQSAYNTPLLIELPTRKILVTMMASHILGIDASNGKLLWNYEQTNRWSVHANTPVYSDGAVFCFSGYGQGGVKLKLSSDGSSVSKEWFSTDYDSRMGGVVLINGYLYGSGDNNREWMCIDWKTGETKYKSSEVGKGAVIASGNKLIGYSEKGELFLAEANPTEFKLISKVKVELGTAQHWVHPVINDGILYLRHGNTLIAYKISN
ncbi:MAG TPA: hypothetical protein DD458_09165 [Prolixibacteraceae bacterium]|nr:hypothetical protein [Prolixibacteraceae bacterium]HCR90303.1 hypothetical protein [Prolixibacteraceae bacterium]HCU60708.1 hypothetical protein [Prolixibacteraceae bacterium]